MKIIDGRYTYVHIMCQFLNLTLKLWFIYVITRTLCKLDNTYMLQMRYKIKIYTYNNFMGKSVSSLIAVQKFLRKKETYYL